MVMVITLHFMRESGSLLEASALFGVPATKFLGTLLEALCIVADQRIHGKRGRF